MKKYLLVFCIPALLSCEKSNKKETNINSKTKTVHFNIDELSNYVVSEKDSTNLIQLETKKECLINQILRLYFVDKNIIVYDEKKVLLFDIQGRFIREIGKKGRGPEEYTRLTGMWFDDKTNQIEIFDNVKRIMLIYNLEGQLLETKESGIYFTDFAKTNEGYFAYCPFVKEESSKGYNLFLLDDKLQLTEHKFLPTKNNFDRATHTERFTQNNSDLFFRHGMNDTIYKIEGKGVKPYLYIDFGKNKLPYAESSAMLNQKLFDEQVYLNEPNYIGLISNVLINNNDIIFTFSKIKFGPRPLYTGVYNRNLNSIDFFDSFTSKVYGVSNTYPIFLDNEKSVYVSYAEDFSPEEIAYIEKRYKIKTKTGNNPMLFFNYE